MYQYSYLVEQVEVLLSQFEWKSRDSPTETRLTDRYRSLSFVTPANFPRAVTVRRMANDVTYTMYTALPIHLYVYKIYGSTNTTPHKYYIIMTSWSYVCVCVCVWCRYGVKGVIYLQDKAVLVAQPNHGSGGRDSVIFSTGERTNCL